MVKRGAFNYVSVLLASTLLAPVASANDSTAVNSFFFEPKNSGSNSPDLPLEAQRRRQAQNAQLSGEDRARLLHQGFACAAHKGSPGQASCAETEEAARMELMERVRQNHEVAKKRMREQ